jgi:large subunit ribosomal protein L20
MYGPLRKTPGKKGWVMPIPIAGQERNFRALWITRINAGVRQHGMSYSEFIGKLSEKGIALNRKALADLAMNNPEAFEAVVNSVK